MILIYLLSLVIFSAFSHRLAMKLAGLGMSPLKTSVAGFAIVELLASLLGVVFLIRGIQIEGSLFVAILIFYVAWPASFALKCHAVSNQISVTLEKK